MKKVLLVMLSLVLLASCNNIRTKVQDKAKEYILSNAEKKDSVKFLAISEPDSAFGKKYLTDKEVQGLTTVVMKVNEILLKNYPKPGSKDYKPDPYMMSLARRQAQAGVALLEVPIDGDMKKDKWSGWKVKVDYKGVDEDGVRYRAERWFFFDQKGEKIERTFEIALP